MENKFYIMEFDGDIWKIRHSNGYLVCECYKEVEANLVYKALMQQLQVTNILKQVIST